MKIANVALGVALTTGGMALVGLAVGGAYYASQLLPAEAAEVTVFTATVVAATDTTLAIDAGTAPEWDVDDLLSAATVGFRTVDGYVQLHGEPVEVAGSADARIVTRRYRPVTGRPPTADDRGDIQSYAFPDDDPDLVRPTELVAIEGPLGDLPAWVMPGTSDTWIVWVHGRGGTRAASLRTAAATAGTGFPLLVISHRNDPGAPPSPDGFGHYGDDEWEDLEAALTWLHDTHAPARIVLFGESQGGSVVVNCLRRCIDTDAVTGVVLESPLLSMNATLELQAADRGIPSWAIGSLLTATKVMSAVRSGPDFANLEQVDWLAATDLPVLLFHGRLDTTVPFSTSERLAALDPDDVVFVPYDGEHVRGWNVDPDGWADALLTFLERVG